LSWAPASVIHIDTKASGWRGTRSHMSEKTPSVDLVVVMDVLIREQEVTMKAKACRI